MKVNRRQAIGVGLAGAGVIAAHKTALATSKSPADIVDLKVCGLEAPLALGDVHPRFAWCVPNARQTAFRITVAKTKDALEQGRLIWDSGRVESEKTLDIRYDGPEIEKGSGACWQVESWTKDGRRLKSAVSSWETGRDAADWSAQWLAAETQTARADRLAGLNWIAGDSPIKVGQQRAYRWTFDAAAGPAQFCLSAHLITGLWLNGQPLDLPENGLPWTQMAVFDVNLTAGRNVIAVSVVRKSGFGVPPPTLAVILREGPNLTDRRSSASPGWRSAIDPAPGWEALAFDDTAWGGAIPAKGTLPVGQTWPDYPASHLRKQFRIEKPIKKARLRATALGCYDAWLNGRPVDNRKLAPEFSDPAKHLLYQSYDVTALLSTGENMLGLHVGDGWYGGKFSSSGRFSLGSAPCRVLACLEIEYQDGTQEEIGTGPTWQIADSAVRASSIYDGEIYDARLDDSEWCKVGSSASSWRPAEVLPPTRMPDIEPQRCPPIRPMTALSAVQITRLGPGNFVVDFGQNFAGWPSLSVAAPKGAEIIMRFAELLRPDGHVDQTNLRTALARDIFIASGRGRETWEPRFTYHGFRYVELTGVPDDLQSWSLKGIVGHQNLSLTGTFRCGDPVVEKFWQNSVWSQKSNFFGLPTDCPQRDERLGWMGDAQVFWPAASWNMDTQAFTARVMDEMRTAQKANGGFIDCIPPFFPGLTTSSPGWADAGIVLPWTCWQQYGDTSVIQRNWAAMDRYLTYIEVSNPNYIWAKARGADYGDWLAVDANPANPGEATTPKDLIGTAFWAENARMMSDMATAIGRHNDAQRYRQLRAKLGAAFMAAFVKEDGRVGNESQTGYVLAIRFGLLRAEQVKTAGMFLAADIARRGGHLSTGFLGTPHILDALDMSGQPQAAIALLTQRTFPSWGYMVEKGATTMWERWDSDRGDTGMNSHNHYAFGAIGSYLFRRVAGIETLTPGFSAIRVAPVMTPKLGQAGATYLSVRGKIKTDWKVNGSHYRLDVEIPPGIDAEVHLPDNASPVRAKGGLNRFGGRL